MAARMVAMEAATDNAKKLKDDIEKKMNRARQALVTQELAELVGAARRQTLQSSSPRRPWPWATAQRSSRRPYFGYSTVWTSSLGL